MKNTIAGASLVLASSVSMWAAVAVYDPAWYASTHGLMVNFITFGGVQFVLGLCFFFLAFFEKDKPKP